MPRSRTSNARRWSWGRTVLLFAGLALASGSAVACGGKGPLAGGEKKPDLDADPLALLPAGAVGVANIDARALYSSGSIGAPIAAIGDSLLPLGEQAGLLASRDVDRVVAAGYATGGMELAAVVSGRFDLTKIAAATTAKNGAPITRGTYSGFTTYTVGATTCAALSAKTMVAGTGDGVRRVLERVQQGHLERTVPPWMVETLETKGAEIAAAADFASQPVTAAALASVNLAWIRSLRIARVIGNFEPPGMNFAATLSYADTEQAQSASDGVRLIGGWLRILGPVLGGASIQNLQVEVDKSDVRCKFAVDDQSLRALLALVPRFLPNHPQ